MKLVAVIPARGGSKSIPRKNIQPLAGKPLLAYAVEYARKCCLVDRVIVSTDCEDIAEIAISAGAEVPFLRPEELATDLSQDFGFMCHAADWLATESYACDALALLRPTSPLRPDGLIERAVSLLETNQDATSIRTVAEVEQHPFRAWRICSSENGDGPIESVIAGVEEPYNLPRQQLPRCFYQTGDLEVVRVSTLMQGSVSGDRVYPLIIDSTEMFDIDSWVDLERAARGLKQ